MAAEPRWVGTIDGLPLVAWGPFAEWPEHAEMLLVWWPGRRWAQPLGTVVSRLSADDQVRLFARPRRLRALQRSRFAPEAPIPVRPPLAAPLEEVYRAEQTVLFPD